MRIVVHDYAGHPFQVQLSRALARRGHEVLHLYSSSIVTPQGAMVKGPDDPEGFRVQPLVLSQKIDRGKFFSRRKLEIEHGRLAVEAIKAFGPEVVLSANTPLEAQSQILKESKAKSRRFVYWVQDLIGPAAKRLLPERVPVVGGWIGSIYDGLEQRMLAASDQVVVISEDFRPLIPLSSDRVRVIENWAPLEEVPVNEKVNPWSTKHGLDARFVYLYSGTLGMKHNPELLIQLAKRVAEIPDHVMVVASEGASIDWLRERANELGITNLVLLPFQPFAELPAMLASADVLVAILEPDAGVFSVPSKVLTYHCAGRPMLLAVPLENLSAKIVQTNQTGIVVSPADKEGFIEGAVRLASDPEARRTMGANARRYAERAFAIDSITDQFETVLKG
ncbi:MAG: glycosyltransferase family 4 protein [Fimbriimonadaceae bacterium]|nr:glycosyltransferase family 4 protein [Fimbriimonadaceae bacterium]QYK57263.1 MAG: glycosyltransferase family 4 protein [Fimbriimonadaceae bacterium]